MDSDQQLGLVIVGVILAVVISAVIFVDDSYIRYGTVEEKKYEPTHDVIITKMWSLSETIMSTAVVEEDQWWLYLHITSEGDVQCNKLEWIDVDEDFFNSVRIGDKLEFHEDEKVIIERVTGVWDKEETK